MNVLWADADLVSVTVDYEHAELTLRETTGATVVVCGHGVLGAELAGLWDETIVASGALVDDDPFAARCWAQVEQRHPGRVADSGSPDRNARAFRTLAVTLVDGCVLRVVAGRFTVRR